MHILGIETSCDETAAAVVDSGRRIRSSIVASSLKEHSRFGGIIPEIASRRQMEFINFVVHQALKEAGLKLNNIDAIAVTHSPGLIGSLLVGISFARSLAYALDKPLIPVDHVKAHLYANFLTEQTTKAVPPTLPAVGLVVSGGHTSLYRVTGPATYRLMGKTRDDAAGEAFDKVARLLELGYPGGPAIDRLAKKGRPGKVTFSCSRLPGTNDFSFSGIKTAVLYYTQDKWPRDQITAADIALAFEDSVTAVLVEKCIAFCRAQKISTVLVGGGVAANSMLRQRLAEKASAHGITVHIPPMALCLDNAAMIAGFGYHKIKITKQRSHCS